MRNIVGVVAMVIFLGLLALVLLTGPNTVPGEYFDWEVLTFVTNGHYGEYAHCERCNIDTVIEIPMGSLPSDIVHKCKRCGLAIEVSELDNKK